jgi:hypothetical protein
MGTSSQSSGPNSGTPLVPSWLDEPSPTPAIPQAQPAQPGEDPVTPLQPILIPPRPVQIPDQPQRFRIPRTNFSRFASSAGSDSHSMGRALSSYVSSGLGGTRNATRRMGSAVSTARNVASFFSDVQKSGLVPILERLNLSHLATRPLSEVLTGLTDILCPPGGPIDEGIARDAWLETIAEATEQGITDFNSLTPDLLEEIFITYVSNSIEGRVFQDIGTKGIARAEDLDALNRLERTLHDYISGSVRDAFYEARQTTSLANMDRVQIDRMVENTYRSAWAILEAYDEDNV